MLMGNANAVRPASVPRVIIASTPIQTAGAKKFSQNVSSRLPSCHFWRASARRELVQAPHYPTPVTQQVEHHHGIRTRLIVCPPPSFPPPSVRQNLERYACALSRLSAMSCLMGIEIELQLNAEFSLSHGANCA